jgi:ABC-type cobalt transport system substrate-binding protein
MKGLSIFLVILLILFSVTLIFAGAGEGKWAGVDETVVEKFAAKAGRIAKEPFITKEQGDLILFVFLIAGVAGGFVAGYYFRVLFHEKGKRGLPKE